MKTSINYVLAVLSLIASSFTAQAQVKIGTNPTITGASSNLEVEASTPNRKVKVDKVTGQLTIQDGTEGNLKILTSDAVGGASWQSTATLRIPTTAFTAYNTNDVVVTTATGSTPARVPFAITNPVSSTSWNAALNEYTIPGPGIYRIEFNAVVDNVSLSPGKTYYAQYVALYVASRNATYQLNGGSPIWGPNMFVTGAFAGGEKVKVEVSSYSPPPTFVVDQLTFKGANLIVTKIE